MVAQVSQNSTPGADTPAPDPNGDNTATVPWDDIAAVGLWQSGTAECGCAEHRHADDSDEYSGGAPATLHDPGRCARGRGDAELDPRLAKYLHLPMPESAATVSVTAEELAGALRGVPVDQALAAVAQERESEAAYAAAGIERIERRLALAAELEERGLGGDLSSRLRDQLPEARIPRRYLPLLQDIDGRVPRCGKCGRTRSAAARTDTSNPAAASGAPPIGNLGGPVAFSVPPAPGVAPAPIPGGAPPIGNLGGGVASGAVPPVANRPVGPAPASVPFSESDSDDAEMTAALAALEADPDDAFGTAVVDRHAEKMKLVHDLAPYLHRISEPALRDLEVKLLMEMTRADRTELVDAAVGGRLWRLGLSISKFDPTGKMTQRAWERVREPEVSGDRYVDGGEFIYTLPDTTPAVWGRGDEVLWAQGEALIVAGSQGVGKSTLAGNLVLNMITGGELLGYPVQQAERILYLAMDRPQQIARALARQLKQLDRETISKRLAVWQGPPPEDLAAHPDRLLAMAQKARASVVIVDSLKDAALGLSSDEVGAGWNRARQTALAAGVQVLELHHDRKVNDTSAPMIEKIYGSVWITSGSGSVIHLGGEPGDPVVRMYHLKQPASEVGPFDIAHDNVSGTMTIHEAVDLAAMCSQQGGTTAKAAACALYDMERPTPGQVEKARRRLRQLVSAGTVTESTVGGVMIWTSA
ncbi:Gp153 [Mycobacteroides abscessus subsp. abscessus]|uniref:AAA family ATPase n=1 Tax=Mycobacteroides abscessus TaxID=36809 RepID=UPI0009259DC9|nr:AAA family ATPase [Mycobacteroides abscessus]SHX68353.1 Gp153 [Mycobacteroides abscessus subsp. abscessus]SIC58075.1 Gp153 [Mycobacteroides abscessus subsp. abscessus]SKK19407.1 Gp153 [Mycobacteroides abscessus subsp. abscessus]SKP49030.1 Gp153 [Mycobacteroides abscessus subsp. abscessus]